MLRLFVYDMYISPMSDFYLYDLISAIYSYLNCLSYVSYYNGSKVPDIAVKSTQLLCENLGALQLVSDSRFKFPRDL